MRAHVSESTVAGVVHVPGSKSYTIRAAVCAAMADGVSHIEGAQHSDDASAVFECLRGLGARVEIVGDEVHVQGGALHAPALPLWCGESGATFRFVAALAATIPGVTVLRCALSLARRPLQPLLDAIHQVGVTCEFDPSSGTLAVHGREQTAGRVTLRADVSSQFLSAMLISGPRYTDGLRLDLSSPIVSGRYVEMTRACMREFGVDVKVSEYGGAYVVPIGGFEPARYVVEGDWSGAAAVLALGALAGDVSVATLHDSSLQADVAVLDLLERMGARVARREGVVRVSASLLKPCSFHLAGAIDLLPVACALGALAPGVTRLTGIARARDKESDRVAAMAEGLARLGVRVDVDDDEMRIWGGTVHGGAVSSAGDHRIAMAFGVLGAAEGNVTVEGAECVSKTYPGFWDAMSKLGVKVTYDEQ